MTMKGARFARVIIESTFCVLNVVFASMQTVSDTGKKKVAAGVYFCQKYSRSRIVHVIVCYCQKMITRAMTWPSSGCYYYLYCSDFYVVRRPVSLSMVTF